MENESLTYGVVWFAGLASFFSPCMLPIFPSFLAYITGTHVKRDQPISRWTMLPHTVAFLLGFSTVFVLLGISIGFIGHWLLAYQTVIRQAGGVFLILWGAVMLGVIKPKFLMRTIKIELPTGGRKAGLLSAFLIGLTFAVGWTPCVGPILSSVLTLGVSQPNQAFIYMLIYITGFSVPFIVMALFVGKTKGLAKYSTIIMKIGGAIFIVMGILLFTNRLAKISAWLLTAFQ
jgi:cytochrome c-type biogenesis protein